MRNFFSSGLEIVKSSSCQRHAWLLAGCLEERKKKDLKASVASNVCESVGSEVCCFCFALNNGWAPVGPSQPWPARFNRDTRCNLMCAALREKRRHVLLLLCRPAASFST